MASLAKKKKVVLVVPPYKEGSKGHLPLLSLGYVAAFLERNDYEVKIIDSVIYGWDAEETKKAVLEENPDAVGLTSVSSSRFSAIKTIELLRKESPELFIFAGGRHFHSTWKSALNSIPSLDAIVNGEGELTCVDLLNTYFNEGELEKVKGISYRSTNGEIIKNPAREPIKDIDSLPMAAWHLFDLEKYSAMLEGEYETRAIGVISGRGCPNQCTFCANNAFSPILRLRSPKKFVDEMEFLNKTYGYKAFDIWDDTLTMVKSHINGICDEIIKRKLDIIWYARARVNTVDEEILSRMKQAGCRVIGFGVESGSEKVLKNIKKYITPEQIKKAVYLSAKLGFTVKGWIIYGLPGETLYDLRKTRDLMRHLRWLGAKFGSAVKMYAAFPLLYPGTALLQQAIDENTVSKDFNWNKEVFFNKNKELGSDPVIPMYENKNFSITGILKFNRKYNFYPKTIAVEAIYQIRQIKSFKDFKKFLSKVVWFFKKIKL